MFYPTQSIRKKVKTMIQTPQPVVPPPPPQQPPWKIKYPSILTGIFSFFQFVVTVAIIGCEVGSVLIDMVTATFYVGFWSGLFFMGAWISQASAGM